MNARITPCMGGFCARRAQCPNYHAIGGEPEERLCIRGQDGVLLADLSSGATVELPAVFRRVVRAVDLTPAVAA
jgi:hypothetical protein